ncbi:MAG TPA: hypothetical protein VD994_09795 [Prosthecobacter sp.]|nr:hypothetical protein [Prosthecobacter sp.]
MRFLFHLLLLVGLSALAGAAWVAHRPVAVAPLTPAPPAKGNRPRDVVDELRQAAIKRSAPLEISEQDLNRHLASVLAGPVREPLGEWAKFERIAVELEPDLARLTLVWDVHGQRSTVTVDLTVERQEKSFRVQVVGGSYGHLEVPRGLLRPLAPMLRKLSQALEPDINALFQMNQVRVAKDKLVLDPRFL